MLLTTLRPPHVVLFLLACAGGLAPALVTATADDDGRAALPGPVFEATATNGQLAVATERYTPPGGQLDYLILTSTDLVEAWQPFAEYQRSLGLRTQVLPVERPLAAFPGCDPPDSIRQFVRHLHTEHGLRWLLLGGDVAEVPGRYLVFRHPSLGVKPYVVDAYYACLSGDWNRNRNAEFGEPQDAPDLTPQVYVGRVSAQTEREVAGWIAKYRRYREPEIRDYQHRLLCIGGDVFQDGDAAKYYDELTSRLFTPGGFSHKALTPRTDDCDERHVFEEISRGYGIISHYEHSYIYNVGLDKGSITLQNYKRASNAQRPSVMWSNGCNVCQFDYRSIAEALLLSEDGGVVALVGSSETNFASSLQYEVRAWNRVLNEGQTLGEALLNTKSELRQHLFHATSLSLLGDPSMPIWTGVPRDAQAEVRGDTIVVTAGGTPVEGATVRLLADGYAATGTTDASGSLRYPRPGRTTTATLAVVGANVVPLSTKVTLPAASDSVTLDAILVDGRELPVRDGVVQLPTASFTCRFSGEAKNLACRVLGAARTSEQQLNGAEAAVTFEPGDRTCFVLQLGTGQTLGLQLPEHHYSLTARLDGNVLVVRVAGPGTDRSPVSVAIDGLTADGFRDGAFRFRANGRPPATVTATVTVDGHAQPARQIALSRPPAAPGGFESDAKYDSIRVNWSGPAGHTGGWLVWRAAERGAFELVTPMPVMHPTFLDQNLQGLTTYRYRVAAVAPDGFVGSLSDEFSTSTALRRLADWPKRTGHPVDDPILADLDNDGEPELIAGDEGLGLWIWHRDGTEWRHGGDNWTFGLFMQVEGGVFTPAIADLDGDGKPELITAGRMNDRRMYVWHLDGTEMKGWEDHKLNGRQMTPPRVTDLDQDGSPEVVVVEGFGKGIWIWNADGTPFNEGKARITTIGQYNYFLGPILDVDDDGAPEIIVLDGDGKVQAINGDGTPVPGYPVNLGGPGRAAMVAGDVTGDGKPELVALAKGGSELVVMGLDGKTISGFPIALADKKDNYSSSFPVLAQLDDRPGLEIVVGNFTGKLWIIGSDGKPWRGWPKEFRKGAYSIAVGDLTGNGKPEIVVGCLDKQIHAFTTAGETVRGFPLSTDGDNRAVPFLGDFDGDNQLDLLYGSADGHVHAWSLDVPFKPSTLQWNGQSNGVNTPGVWMQRSDDKPWQITIPHLAPPPATVDAVDADSLRWETIDAEPGPQKSLEDCRSPVLRHERYLATGQTLEILGHSFSLQESRGRLKLEHTEPGARRARAKSLRLPTIFEFKLEDGREYAISIREAPGGVRIASAFGLEVKVGGDSVALVDSDLDGTLGSSGDGIVVPGARTVAVWAAELWTDNGAVMLRQADGAWQTADRPLPEDRTAAAVFRRLNWRRQQAGLAPVQYASDMADGLAAHAAFCARHRACTRSEDKGARGYSDDGADAAANGVFTFTRDALDGLEQMLASGWCRYELLAPGLRATCVVLADGVLAIDTGTLSGGPHAHLPVVWPPHGASNVAATFRRAADCLLPDNAAAGSGLPIGLRGGGLTAAGLELEVEQLDRRGNAEAVTGDLIAPADGTPALFLASDKLPGRTRLRCRLRATLADGPLDYEWEFTTD